MQTFSVAEPSLASQSTTIDLVCYGVTSLHELTMFEDFSWLTHTPCPNKMVVIETKSFEAGGETLHQVAISIFWLTLRLQKHNMASRRQSALDLRCGVVGDEERKEPVDCQFQLSGDAREIHRTREYQDLRQRHRFEHGRQIVYLSAMIEVFLAAKQVSASVK